MESVANFFLEGGPWMYVILLLGLAGVTLAVIGAAAQARAATVASVVCLVAVVALGGLAFGLNRMHVDAALAAVNPADAETIRAVGYAESLRPIQLAGGIAVLGVPLMLLAVMRRRHLST